MGLLLSRLQNICRSSTFCRILMVGLGGAGKTTILYNLTMGQVVTSKPPLGPNLEAVEYKNLYMTVWDVGGHKHLRDFWQHYLSKITAIIFVVDSSSPERFPEAREELEALLNMDELKDCPLLVLANKQDLPLAASEATVTESLGLQGHIRDWHVQATCAITNSGIYEGLDWLACHVISK